MRRDPYSASYRPVIVRTQRAHRSFISAPRTSTPSRYLETNPPGEEATVNLCGLFCLGVAHDPSVLEVAHRGVMFLDEIGDLDPQVQPKLLKVLEEKRFRRLGDVALFVAGFFTESLSRSLVDVDYYVCSVCGMTVEKEAPEKCPVCGAAKKAFYKVA